MIAMEWNHLLSLRPEDAPWKTGRTSNLASFNDEHDHSRRFPSSRHPIYRDKPYRRANVYRCPEPDTGMAGRFNDWDLSDENGDNEGSSDDGW